MGAFSDYIEGKIVDHFLRNSVVTSPAAVYVGLFESDPGEAVGGTETAYTNYARQMSTWTALDASGQTKNVGSLLFPANGNAVNSVTISHLALFDAATGGNRLLYAELKVAGTPAPKTLAPGDVLFFAANAIVFGLD